MSQPLSNESSTWILADAEGNVDGNTEPRLDAQGGDEPGPLDPSPEDPQGGEHQQQSEANPPGKDHAQPPSHNEPPSRFRRVAGRFGSFFASKTISYTKNTG